MTATMFPAWHRRTVHPGYIIKNPLATLLFTIFAMTGAFFVEPKLIVAVSTDPRVRAATLTILSVCAVSALAVLFLLIYSTLQLRYVLRLQAVAASMLFLTLTAGAALVGYAARMAIAPPAGVPRAFSPAAYTLREGLVACTLLLATGSLFTAAQNLTFLRKADYTDFGTRRGELVSHITAMAARLAADEMLTPRDAATALERATAALSALDKTAKADDPRYRAFVDSILRPAVEILQRYIADPQVQKYPDLIPRACGLTPIARPVPPQRADAISAAFRLVRESR